MVADSNDNKDEQNTDMVLVYLLKGSDIKNWYHILIP